MAYDAYHKSNGKLTFDLIERFIKKTKTHRNIGDQEKGLLSKCREIPLVSIINTTNNHNNNINHLHFYLES